MQVKRVFFLLNAALAIVILQLFLSVHCIQMYQFSTHTHPVITDRNKQYVADISKNVLPYWYWENGKNYRGQQSCSWQWQICPRGTLPGPPPYQSLQSGGHKTPIQVPSDPHWNAGYSLRNKFRQKPAVANVAATAYGRTHSPPGISK